jgi:protein-S-isoprenylcysteine O-methyltransferase Ste14
MSRNILAYILGAFIVFIVVPGIMVYLASLWYYPFMPENKIPIVFGAFSSAVGLVFVIWANYELIKKGHGGAVVVGAIKLSSETVKLVTTGPYSICRNPMHLGLVLFYLGFSCALNSLMALLVPALVLCGAYLFARFIDEPRLKRDFPSEYEKWVKDVPQRFWPKAKKS